MKKRVELFRPKPEEETLVSEVFSINMILTAAVAADVQDGQSVARPRDTRLGDNLCDETSQHNLVHEVNR